MFLLVVVFADNAEIADLNPFRLRTETELSEQELWFWSIVIKGLGWPHLKRKAESSGSLFLPNKNRRLSSWQPERDSCYRRPAGVGCRVCALLAAFRGAQPCSPGRLWGCRGWGVTVPHGQCSVGQELPLLQPLLCTCRITHPAMLNVSTPCVCVFRALNYKLSFNVVSTTTNHS